MYYCTDVMRYHRVITVKIADFKTCCEVSDKTGSILLILI